MTIQEIINWFSLHPNFVLGYFLTLVAIALIGMLYVNKENFKTPLTHFYGVLVYLVTVPGMLSVILLLYNFFFLKTNLLNIDLITYFLPIVCSGITLFVINRTVPLNLIPGFDKLSGLMILIFITFMVMYVLQKMFFGIFFVGGMTTLLIIFAVIFVVLKLGWSKLTGGKKE